MPFSQADIDTLRRAIATGARKVSYGFGSGKREVEYRSLDEMRRILADMEAAVSGAARPRTTYVEHHRS